MTRVGPRRFLSPKALFPLLIGTFLLSANQTSAATPLECLTNVIYQESRSDPHEGQVGVAYTVFNRAHSGRYSVEICYVTNQWKQYHNIKKISDKVAWSRAERIGKLVLYQAIDDPTLGATHFIKCGSKAEWLVEMEYTVKLGSHCFYKRKK